MTDIEGDLEKSDIEPPYTQYNRSSSLSPPPSISLPNDWTDDTVQEHEGRRDGTYRSVHKDSRALKVATSHHRDHQHLHYAQSDFNHAQPYQGSRPTHRSSPYHTPRSNGRLPSVIDRMKADLKSSNRSTTNNDYDSSLSHSPQNSDLTALHHEIPLQTLPPPSLFGVKCTEVSQKAYSGQSSQMKKGFEMLQKIDNGKVEYRTIAFCTHLTVSRWEPTTLPPAASNDMPTSQAAPISAQGHAARLMSLANYIRHILSLTVAVPNSQPLASTKQHQPTKEDTRNNNVSNSNSLANSSGPGPIKSDSNRRHRFSAYNSGRRNPQTSEVSHRDHSLQAEGQIVQRNDARESSHIQEMMGLSSSQQSSQNQTRNSSPLLKIPFPNLTLTLALIYVDRLKAKYPDAKGEPGCSHRLFLMAFIIAAKYRCSVELSAPLPQDLDANDSNGEHSEMNDNIETRLETRLDRELVFSNHAWVRLLNLGSFYRQSSTSTSSVTDNQEQNSNAEPMREQPSHTAQSSAPIPSQENHTSLPSIINATSSPIAGMLQVEDLDRMEAEFLTFLNFDLATMGHDLDTCWNLLVGKNNNNNNSNQPTQ
ncbi:hypothetical protein BGZ76_000031 [Entomortierella beljakovae]|nr:hypothetical protein BGZ76_000031 [Entomortierella beljakovae]